MRKYTSWFWCAAILQILTAAIHSLSFLNKPQPTGETEKQMIDLMATYHLDMGAGFHPTMFELFNGLSAGFALLFLFGGLMNIFLLRKKAGDVIIKGALRINLLVFTIIFVVSLLLTFLPPAIMTGLIFISLLSSTLLSLRTKA